MSSLVATAGQCNNVILWKFWHLPHWLIRRLWHMQPKQATPAPWAGISWGVCGASWSSWPPSRHLRQRFATANIIAVIANGLPIGSPLLPFRWSALEAGRIGHDQTILGNFACHPPSPIANGLLIYAFHGDYSIFSRQSDMLSAMGKPLAVLKYPRWDTPVAYCLGMFFFAEFYELPSWV